MNIPAVGGWLLELTGPPADFSKESKNVLAPVGVEPVHRLGVSIYIIVVEIIALSWLPELPRLHAA